MKSGPSSPSIPDYVSEASAKNYKAACKVKIHSFPSHGQYADYNIGYLAGIDTGTSEQGISAHNLVKAILSTKAADSSLVRGVDLGTGLGVVPASLNEAFPGQVDVKGITAHNPLTPPAHVIYGNIQDLPSIPYLQENQVDFFISSYAFSYVGDPLKIISDAYAKLNEHGFLLIDDVHLQGLDNETANAMFEYLRRQGYDILTGPSSEGDPFQRENSWGPGWIFLRKNEMSSLNFPVEYNGAIEKPVVYNARGDFTKITFLNYEPNAALKQFAKTYPKKKNREFDAVAFQRLQEWGMISGVDDIHLKQLKESLVKIFDQYIKSIGFALFSTNHKNRAIEVKSAIMNAHHLQSIEKIILNQLGCFTSDHEVTPTQLLASRWSKQHNIKNPSNEKANTSYVTLLKQAQAEINATTANIQLESSARPSTSGSG